MDSSSTSSSFSTSTSSTGRRSSFSSSSKQNGGAIAINGLSNINTGSISGGAITLNSSGNINTGSIDSTSFSSSSFSFTSIGGTFSTNTTTKRNGEAVALTSMGNINTGSINSSGGTIALNSLGYNITTGSLDSSSTFISSSVGAAGNGGAITLNATNININGSISSSYSAIQSDGTVGNGGAINLDALGNIFAGSLISLSSTNIGNSGNGGAISLNGANINIGSISTYSATNSGVVGTGGSIVLNAIDNLSIASVNNIVTGNVGYGDISLTGNEINLTGGITSVRGNGKNIVLQASNSSQAIQVGGDDSGSNSILDISDTDLAALAPGFNEIIIGRSDSSGAITINDAGFTSPVTFRTPNGQISVNSNLEGNLNFISNGLSISNGISLTLGKSEEIVDTANLILNGGTFNLNGFNETANQLTFSTNSAINFGTNNNSLTFSASNSQPWAGILSINNWTTSKTLRFGTNATGLNAAQLERIQFSGFNSSASIDGLGFVTPSNIDTFIAPPIIDIIINTGSGDGASDGNSTFIGNPSGNVGQILATDNAPTSIFQSEIEGLNASTPIVLQANGSISFGSSRTAINFGTNEGGGGGNITFAADFDGDGSGQYSGRSKILNASGRNLSISGAGVTTNGINTFNQTDSGNSGNGGAIALNSAGNINTSSIDSSSSSYSYSPSPFAFGSSFVSFSKQNGGAIALNGSGNINTGSIVSSGGVISLNGSGNINTGSIDSSSYSQSESFYYVSSSKQNGGAIAINGLSNINTGSINSSGGTIALNSLGYNITTGSLDSSSTYYYATYYYDSTSSSVVVAAGNGGAITLNATNININDSISSYSAIQQGLQQGVGTLGNGGSINLSTTNNLDVQAINKYSGYGKVEYGNITLTGNEINLNGGYSSVLGIGKNLILQPSSASQAIQIGGADSGSPAILDLTDTDLAAISSGFNNITIGRSDSSGTIDINADSFTSPVTFRTPNGQININSFLGGNLNFISNGLSISNGKSLTLGNSEEIVDTANLILNGGTFNLNGFNETANQLTFSTNSAIDFGAGNSTLAFSSSSNQTWTGLLTINNWSSSSGETLKFGNDANALTAAQLSQIQFTGDEYDKGAQISSTGVVTPNLIPTLSVIASTPTGTETNSTPGVFTVSSDGKANTDLTVNYTVSGTATNGVDYTSLTGTATIAAGKSSVDIAVTPVDDGIVEGNESVKLTLASGSGYRTNTTKSSASITIIDNSPTPVGTTGNDDLVATTGSKFDGLSNNVFTGSGNDVVDLAINPASNSNRVDLGSGNDTIFVSKNDRVFGGGGNDIFEATDGNGGNRMSGGAGNDTFFLGFGDRALGGDGDDKFFVGTGGGNLLSGGAGADQFWIFTGEIAASPNTIIDFQNGTDVIGFNGASFGFADLIRSGNNIAIGNSIIATLTGIDTSSLTASNFVFSK